MDNITHYIKQAIESNVLCSVMGWDEKHGPTLEQLEAFNILFPEFAL
jgi:hypothetical protein